ncbi:hypothetical protein [Nocardioides euryhalodurans]|uniref:Uncharacterized protein n=1 Tax=Nocardioides euryhalodurans TaxID=2518370 RepID=A0A4P7GMT3_9ACTN|nr:hypothetical protein [Nocardioides euryhalodurans]QBR93330.1 hypothetical protein EXE57_14470 [Nocardioides euryhalodurans]
MLKATTAALSLLLTASLWAATPATAKDSPGETMPREPRGDRFRFTVATDEDNSGKAESRALDIIYERNLFRGPNRTRTLDAEAGWVDGDRRAYRCGFAFLRYRGFIVGRVTVSKFQDPEDKKSGYLKLNDKFMIEESRDADGTVNLTDRQTRDCTVAAEDYEPFSGKAESPVVTFQHGPHAIDVRDFGDPDDVIVSNRSVAFDLVSATATRVVVLAYEDVEGETLPMASIYYDLVPDRLQGARVGRLTPDTLHPVTLHVGCGLRCGGHESHAH